MTASKYAVKHQIILPIDTFHPVNTKAEQKKTAATKRQKKNEKEKKENKLLWKISDKQNHYYKLPSKCRQRNDNPNIVRSMLVVQKIHIALSAFVLPLSPVMRKNWLQQIENFVLFFSCCFVPLKTQQFSSDCCTAIAPNAGIEWVRRGENGGKYANLWLELAYHHGMTWHWHFDSCITSLLLIHSCIGVRFCQLAKNTIQTFGGWILENEYIYFKKIELYGTLWTGYWCGNELNWPFAMLQGLDWQLV